MDLPREHHCRRRSGPESSTTIILPPRSSQRRNTPTALPPWQARTTIQTTRTNTITTPSQLYKPPVIRHIRDVLPLFENAPEFSIKRTVAPGGFNIHAIDYNYITDNTFNHPLLLECRGLLFDDRGNLIARPLHKFFNLGERPLQDRCLPTAPGAFAIHEKLHGSLVTLAPLAGGGATLCTRAGRTPLAAHIEQAMDAREPQLMKRLRQLSLTATPSLEYVAPDNRIVVNYEKPELLLLALRHRSTGAYLPLPADIPQAPVHPADISLAQLAQSIRNDTTDREGVLVTFPCGHRLKIKTTRYTRVHTASSHLSLEKNALSLILRGQTDDLLPLLPEPIATALADHARKVNGRIDAVAAQLEQFRAQHHALTQKEYAAEVFRTYPSSHIRPIAYLVRRHHPQPASAVLRESIADKLPRTSGTVAEWRTLLELPPYPGILSSFPQGSSQAAT